MLVEQLLYSYLEELSLKAGALHYHLANLKPVFKACVQRRTTRTPGATRGRGAGVTLALPLPRKGDAEATPALAGPPPRLVRVVLRWAQALKTGLGFAK